MPRSDVRSGAVAMESLSTMDSAGSCDSVNSGSSEDSMDHLSAEERACLMYLEETIEALEVKEDSGLSNDEPELVLEGDKMILKRVNDISRGSLKSEKAESAPVDTTSEPESTPAPAANTQETPADLMTRLPEPPVSDEKIQPSAPQTELFVSKGEDGTLKIVSIAEKSPQINLGRIPPPSEFMDYPRPASHQGRANNPPSAGTYNRNPGTTVDLEDLLQRASASGSSSVIQEHPDPLPLSSSPQLRSSPEIVEPRSPPAVAPKPKKLPPNIILKSHKGAVAEVHAVPASSDRLMLDPQKVHMEALRKLGLLKSEDLESSPPLSPKISPKTRRSWAAPSPPVSPAAPHKPATTSFHTSLSSQSPPSGPPHSPAPASPSGPSKAPAVTSSYTRVVPAPTAFSDTDAPLPSENETSAVKDVSVTTQVSKPSRSPPALVKEKTPPYIRGVKSATLERSSSSLSNSMLGQDPAEPSHMRNNRPRPASLGSGWEFSSSQREVLNAVKADSRDSQKLPRSQGISVLICPRAENGDDRREALRRLGLLRD